MPSRCLRPGKQTRIPWRSSSAILSLAVLGLTPDANAIVRRHDVADASYTALGNDSKYTSVAAIQDATHTTSTGVLISPKWVLSAGHAVLPFPGSHTAPASINIGGTTEDNGTSYSVIQSFSPYTGNVTSGTDIGLIQLTSNVTGITPATRWFAPSELNLWGTYIGFGDPGTGQTGPFSEGIRQKRGMHNRLEATGGSIGFNSGIILSDFDDPGNADTYNAWGSSVPDTSDHPLEGLMAGGDSGGGLFVDSNSRWYLAGINSFVVALDPPNGNGGNPNQGGFPFFIYADVNGSTRVSSQNIWIDDNITNNWKTATSGSFGTAGNWSVGTFTSGTPGSGDLAGFNVAGTYTVTFGSSVSNHMLLARRGNVTLDLNGFTYDLTSTMFEGAMVVGRYAGNNTTVTFRSGVVNASSDVTIGHLVSSNGRLQIGPSATLNVAGSMFVGGNADQNAGIGRLAIQDPTSAVNVAGTLRIWANGTVNFDRGTLTAGAIRVEEQGHLILASGADKLVRTGSLIIQPFSSVDLSDNDLLIDYITSPDATLRQYILDGRLFSSAATATLGLGYGDNALLGRTTFDGLPIGSMAEMVKYTYFGDADLDGDVDKSDLGYLARGWQDTGNWIDGDFNYDGVVDLRDLMLMATNWLAGVGDPLGPSFGTALAQAGLPESLAAVALPEPGALLSLAVASGLVLRRRRRG